MNEKHVPDRNVGRGGRRKILDFLLKNVGKHVHTKKLQEVTGGDVQYDRRLRELRDEYGYDIASHNDDVTIPICCYMLRDPSQEKGSSAPSPSKSGPRFGIATALPAKCAAWDRESPIRTQARRRGYMWGMPVPRKPADRTNRGT